LRRRSFGCIHLLPLNLNLEESKANFLVKVLAESDDWLIHMHMCRLCPSI
jgi:hypothetical protein